MEEATHATVQLADRVVTLAISVPQLMQRRAGDLITAKIETVEVIHGSLR